MCLGELPGASDAGCTRDGQGGFCQVAHRKRSEHAPFSNNQSAGGALQHGNIMHLSQKKRLKDLPIADHATSLPLPSLVLLSQYTLGHCPAVL